MANPFSKLLEWIGDEVSERVTPKQAMSLPPFWWGVNKITNHFARLPLYIKRQTIKGGQDKQERHWAYDLLLTRPNGYQTADVFKQQLCGHAICWGNGRAAIVNPGTPSAEIIPMMPDRTGTVMIDGIKVHVTKPEKTDRLPLFESVSKDREGVIVFLDSEVIHLQGFGFDGIEGLSLVSQMKRTLGIPTEQESHAYNQTKKGFVAKLIVETPPGLFTKEADAKEWIKQFNEANSSADNAGKAAMLRNGMKATALSMSNTDSQFLEQRKFSRQDIVLMLGLDGMPGDGDSHSYNSKVMEALNYNDTGLAPWTCKMEMQCKDKLLSISERKRGFVVSVDLAELLRTDPETQSRIHESRLRSRIMNPNECRRELGLNPYDGGDEYINPAISQAGQGTAPKSDGKAQAIVSSSLKRLIRREAKDAISGANKADFCSWIDAHYAKWQPKLEKAFPELHIWSDVAGIHCEKSREMLLDCAGNSKTTEELKENVRKCVESWEDRFQDIINESELQTC